MNEGKRGVYRWRIRWGIYRGNIERIYNGIYRADIKIDL